VKITTTPKREELFGEAASGKPIGTLGEKEKQTAPRFRTKFWGSEGESSFQNEKGEESKLEGNEKMPKLSVVSAKPRGPENLNINKKGGSALECLSISQPL